VPTLITLFKKCRLLIVCAPFVLLQGCGGEVDSIANGIADAMVCGLLRCTESSTYQPHAIATTYAVTQSGSDVHVTASMNQGSDPLVAVLLSPGDTLSAATGNQTVQLGDTTGQRLYYAGDLTTNQSQPTVTVSFGRAGTLYSSSVVMPAQFAMLSSNAPISVTLASGSFNVQLGIPDSGLLGLSITGNCTRVDGSSFQVSTSLQYQYLGVVPGGTSYQVSTSALDTALNKNGQQQGQVADLSLVQSCNLRFAWTQTQSGTISPAMSNNSYISGQTSVTQQVLYNAQH
jgi:hypothetical protein